jgi:hypothetical protein
MKSPYCLCILVCLSIYLCFEAYDISLLSVCLCVRP